MGGFSAHLTGLKELDAKLTELGGAAAQKVIREGLEAGGEVFRVAVAAAAPERAPLASKTAIPPGAMRRDIEVRFGKNSEGLPAAIVQPGKYTRHVARWVEYGHRQIRGGWNRIIKTGRSAGKQRGNGREIGNVEAHPFIRPAYEAKRQEAVDVTVKTIAEGIEKASKRKQGDNKQ